MIRRALGGFLLGAFMVLVVWKAVAGGSEVDVRPGRSVEDAVLSDGQVRLLPGTHRAFQITRPGTTVVGTPGAVVSGPIEVRADDVVLRDLRISGGESGISVIRVEDVVLEHVTVDGARLHGVEVVDGHVDIRGCLVRGLESPYAQGIEIRNATTRPRSTVTGCTVRGGQEGVVTHSARVELRDNQVTGTSMRGLAITEMSEGVMEGNLVESVDGSALYCGDMSHCEIRENTVRDVAPVAGSARFLRGYAVVGWYHSTLRVHQNGLDVPESRRVLIGSGTVLTDRFPPSVWPPGLKGLLPAIWVAGLSLGGLAAVRLALAPAFRRRRRRRPAPDAAPATAGPTNVLLAGFAVQSFHMLEHAVQVVQVYVIDGERRSGLAGSVVDTEWVHFVYNAAVLAFMVWAWRRLRPEEATLPSRVTRWAPWFVAAVLIQGYHLVEHTVKLAQHLTLGVDPAPGLVGGRLGLVWFHFGINLAVYAGLALMIVPRWLHGRRVPRVRGGMPDGTATLSFPDDAWPEAELGRGADDRRPARPVPAG